MKRKIFYFLKTKEEYDYMLTKKEIPRRGIVFIESTQEIYRDQKPYSGYGPLKQYFDSLKDEVLSLVQDNNNIISSMVQEKNLEILEDFNNYLQKSKTDIQKIVDLINLVKTNFNSSDYYLNNTLLPSLESIKRDIQTLNTKNSTLTSLLESNLNSVNTFKNSLLSLSNSLLSLGNRVNSEISTLYTYIKEDIKSLIDNNTSNLDNSIKDWVKSYVSQQLISDSDLKTKVLKYVDLESLESRIDLKIKNTETLLKTYINSRIIAAPSTGTNTGTNTNTLTSTRYASVEYVDSLVKYLQTPASTSTLGMVRVGPYLKIDEGGRLGVDKSALLLSLTNITAEEVAEALSNMALIGGNNNLIAGNVKVNSEGIDISSGNVTLFNASSSGGGELSLGTLSWDTNGQGRLGKNNEISWTGAGKVSIKAESLVLPTEWYLTEDIFIVNNPRTASRIGIYNTTNYPIQSFFDNELGLLVKYYNDSVSQALKEGFMFGKNVTGNSGLFVLSSSWDGMWHKGYTGKYTKGSITMTFVNGICISVG